MRTIFILMDSLRRDALESYARAGAAEDRGAPPALTPNFSRLAEKGIRFDTHYCGSLPCMPARRDIMTGRLNFLHRSWGPLEPFDISFLSLLEKKGVHSHLITDHYHYWETGGFGYHNEFSSAELIRGQERDLWKALVAESRAGSGAGGAGGTGTAGAKSADPIGAKYHPMISGAARRRPNIINREFIREEGEYPIARCVDAAISFLDENAAADDWFLQLELFDPHEPFTAPERFREGLETGYRGPILDWPLYDRLDLGGDESGELRANYAATVRMCDFQLGRLLDAMDRLSLWDYTAVVLTTDHGFLLGEHEWWGKNRMPCYEEISHLPLIVYHPDFAAMGGQARSALTQTIDLAPTFLEWYGIHPADAPAMLGSSIVPALRDGTSVRQAALFGIFGGNLNITDGRHTLFRSVLDPSPELLREYTLLPVHPASFFRKDEFEGCALTREFSFTRGFPVLELPALQTAKRPPMQGGAFAGDVDALYDTIGDPAQRTPLDDPEIEARLVARMRSECIAHEAPGALMKRFGL